MVREQEAATFAESHGIRYFAQDKQYPVRPHVLPMGRSDSHHDET